MKQYIILICGLLLMNLLLSTAMKGQSGVGEIPYGNSKAAGSYISVNGVKIYYEIYGEGPALVLIHGNGGNIAYIKPHKAK
jgi:hypothetical protein